MKLEEKLSTVVKQMKPSGIRKFFDVAKQIEDVISLGVGEPDFDTPWHIREAGIYSIEQGHTHYTENAGLLELRKQICDYYKRRYDLEYQAESDCLVTIGGSEALDNCFRALLNPGDEVIVATPCFVSYEPTVHMAGGVVKYLPLQHQDEFKITPEGLKACITDKTKLLMINFPGNPTGGTMSKEDYAKLVPIIKEHEIIVISDEIYSELIYEGEHASLAHFPEIKDQVLIVNGFSKAFAMTGWRLGYLLGPSTILQAVIKIHQFAIMSAPTTAQYAAIEALKNGQKNVDAMRLAYKARRNLIVDGFNKMGLPTHLPKGAFYIFPDIRPTGLTSDEFCERLIKEQRVACVPGTAFGEAGTGFIRVSYASSLEEIKEALSRIATFVEPFNLTNTK